MKSVYNAVRTGSLNKAGCASSLKGQENVKYCCQKNNFPKSNDNTSNIIKSASNGTAEERNISVAGRFLLIQVFAVRVPWIVKFSVKRSYPLGPGFTYDRYRVFVFPTLSIRSGPTL